MGGNYLVQTIASILLAVAGAGGWIAYYIDRTGTQHPFQKTEVEQGLPSDRSASTGAAHGLTQGGEADLRRAYEVLQSEHAALQDRYSALQSKQASLRLESLKRRTRGSRLEAWLSDAIESRDRLSSQLDSAQSERTRLTGELEAMLEQRVRLTEQMDSGEIDQSQLRARLEDTDEQIQASEAKLQEAQSQIDELRKDRDALQAKLESAKSGQAELRSRIEALNEQIREKESALQVSRERIDELRAQRDDLRTQLSFGERGQEDVRARLTTTGEQIRTMQDALQELRGRIGSITESLDKADAEIDSLAAEIEHQKVIREREQERFAKLKAELENELQSKDVQIEQLRDDLTVIRVGGDVLFNQGSAELRPAGAEALRLIADVLRAFPKREISLEGHTDNVPIGKALENTYPSNWELSAARAARAARFLQIEAGIDPERLRIVGYGQYQPVASNEDAKGKARNRRIEIRLLPKADLPDIVQYPWSVSKDVQ